MKITLLQYAIPSSPEEALDKIAELLAFSPSFPLQPSPSFHSKSTLASTPSSSLAILPELALTGYAEGPPKIAVTPDHLARLQDLAATHRTHLWVGLCLQNKNTLKSSPRYYNQALLFSPEGSITATYTKKKLFPIWKEPEWFSAEPFSPDSTFPFSIGEWQCAPAICFDLRFPELFRRYVGVPLFLVIANWPASRRDHWRALLRARAIENQAFVAGVNRLGEDNGVLFCGDSLLFDYRGELVLDLADKEQAAAAVLDHTALQEFRVRFPFLPQGVQTPENPSVRQPKS